MRHCPTQVYRTLRNRLLDARGPDGCWTGRLSSSALSTATSVIALHAADAQTHAGPIARALAWLVDHRNTDGGWGDTVVSRSNLPTTLLVLSAFRVAGPPDEHTATIASAEAYVRGRLGQLDPGRIIAAIGECYGDDKTFSAPILTACALAGLLGPETTAWSLIPPLPLELAALPHRLLRWLSLPVVSYALPALIAIGSSAYHHHRPANPLTRLIRWALHPLALRKLTRIQPESGGFLEAPPLTGFVMMNLVAADRGHHPTVIRGAQFLLATVRKDGSWPIDTDLATWVTTLAVGALDTDALDDASRADTRAQLLARQYRTPHPYTGTPPGGWAWTGLSGGVPDADDTAGALLALHRLGPIDHQVNRSAGAGVQWLMGLQNRDGGLPTFCRGWGRLPFDRSCPDLTAHAIRAWWVWAPELPATTRLRLQTAIERAIEYLRGTQQPDGTWTPLWFGNESADDQRNATYGTARVVQALCELDGPLREATRPMLDRATAALCARQNDNGGWGGNTGVPSSVEETGVAVEALAAAGACESTVQAGVDYLIESVADTQPAPIGLYFARLWYFEELYPLIFTVAALRRACFVLADRQR